MVVRSLVQGPHSTRKDVMAWSWIACVANAEPVQGDNVKRRQASQAEDHCKVGAEVIPHSQRQLLYLHAIKKAQLWQTHSPNMKSGGPHLAISPFMVITLNHTSSSPSRTMQEAITFDLCMHKLDCQHYNLVKVLSTCYNVKGGPPTLNPQRHPRPCPHP